MKWMIPFAIVFCLMRPSVSGAQSPVTLDDLGPLVDRLQAIAETSDRDGFLTLLTPDADLDAARDFARDGFREDVDRTVVYPRFLIAAEEEGDSHELTVELFAETGDRARLQTWSLQVARAVSTPESAPGNVETENTDAWVITDYEALDSIDTLHHLRLNPDKQFDAENVVIVGEDMTLQMSSGSVFVAEVGSGITCLVLVGDGVMTFDPSPEAERRQVEIFAGDETLEVEFTHAFVRVNPSMLSSRVSPSSLTETPFSPRAFRQAQEFFDAVASHSYTVDLSNVSERSWWLTPTAGHFQAEVSTRQFGVLTFAQAQNQPEDVTLYQREPLYTVISRYPSARQRAVQGKYYDDQDSVPYDILDYDIVASFEPAGVIQESLRARAELEGCWIEGTTRLAVRVTGVNFSNLALQLANDLNVHSVTSREFGPLLFFRMGGPNNLVISLPDAAPIGTEFNVVISYSGLLRAQEPDENWLGSTRELFRAQSMFGIGERRYIYSGSTAWYPQGVIPDFATATMELTVPPDYGIVASGDAAEDNPQLSPLDDQAGPKSYQYTTLQPAKYLSVVLSRFSPHETPVRQVPLDVAAAMPPVRSGVVYDGVELAVETNPRSRELLSDYSARAQDILEFFGSVVGDMPYPTFTLALTDSILPGGHSPAYFSVLNQPLPLSPGLMWSWGDDPVAFSDTDHFFFAHELAHQWWGQAVGWTNYHEQWLSEGLAQYFAALYAEQIGGPELFHDILSQMRRWAMQHSDEGPIYLGYRLGHLDGEPRIFRALVYNKGAMVLHMLRGLIGDDAFFAGLRRFYHQWRFQKAGTDALQLAFEIESGRSLTRFFERWIHESALPELRFSHQVENTTQGEEVVLRFEQLTERIFDLPVTVTLAYGSGEEEAVVVPVTDRVTAVRIPTRGRVSRVRVDPEEVTLAEIDR